MSKRTPKKDWEDLPFSSDEERELFRSARRQFAKNGKLDLMRAFLRRGSPPSQRAAEELADLLEGHAHYAVEPDFVSDVGYSIQVIAINPRHHPRDQEKRERNLEAAKEVYRRIQNGEKKTVAINGVSNERHISPRDVRAAMRELGYL